MFYKFNLGIVKPAKIIIIVMKNIGIFLYENIEGLGGWKNIVLSQYLNGGVWGH